MSLSSNSLSVCLSVCLSCPFILSVCLSRLQENSVARARHPSLGCLSAWSDAAECGWQQSGCVRPCQRRSTPAPADLGWRPLKGCCRAWTRSSATQSSDSCTEKPRHQQSGVFVYVDWLTHQLIYIHIHTQRGNVVLQTWPSARSPKQHEKEKRHSPW